jgi:hypothetical protein
VQSEIKAISNKSDVRYSYKRNNGGLGNQKEQSVSEHVPRTKSDSSPNHMSMSSCRVGLENWQMLVFDRYHLEH